MTLPDLSRFDRFAIDTETTGTAYGDYPVGMSVSTPDGQDHYLAWGHPEGNNTTLADVMKWAKVELARPSQTCVMFNAGFDLRMMAYVNLKVGARVEDAQFVCALLNELEPQFSLDYLSEKYTGTGKQSDEELYGWLAQRFGGVATRNVQAGRICKAPGTVVAPYAKGDTRATLSLYDARLPDLMKDADLAALYEVETALIPILLKMHLVGVRLDVEKARRLEADLVKRKAAALAQWEALTGGKYSYTSTPQLAVLFKELGLPVWETDKGNPSITTDLLNTLDDHEVPRLIKQMKFLDKMSKDFAAKLIKNTAEDGCIHGEFHPLKNESYGTVSGRFSSGGALNLQNIPARDEEVAPLIRGLFVPWSPDHLWAKSDYSQIEYRYLAHYAGGQLRRAYLLDPTIDFHAMCAELTGIPRKPAKNINFGFVYGMGEALLAQKLGKSLEEAQEIFEQYHERLPEVKELYKKVANKADERGWIRTWGGRLRRFPENKDYGKEKISKRGKSYRDRSRHSFTHKALNALLQGSAADLMKKAMVRVANELVDWENTFLHLTVHDELDFSVPKGRDGDVFLGQVKEAMEDFELTVPILADPEVGPDWGHVQEWKAAA